MVAQPLMRGSCVMLKGVGSRGFQGALRAKPFPLFGMPSKDPPLSRCAFSNALVSRVFLGRAWKWPCSPPLRHYQRLFDDGANRQTLFKVKTFTKLKVPVPAAQVQTDICWRALL